MNLVKDRPIRQKLILMVVAVLGSFAVLNTFIYLTLTKTQSSSELLERTHGGVELAGELLATLNNMNGDYRGFLITGEQHFAQAFDAGQAGYRQKMESLKQLAKDDPEQLKRWNELDGWVGAWQSNVTSRGLMMRQMVNDKKIPAEVIARFEGSGVSQQHFDQITQILRDAIASSKASMAASALQDARNNTLMRMVIVWGAVLAFALAIPIMFVIAGSIAVPMRELTGIASALALGDVSLQVTHRSKDEIGVLADSFRSMTVYIRDIASVCEAMGKGDLTAELQPRSGKDIIAVNFGHAMDSLRQTLRQMADSAASLTSASEKLSATSGQMTTNAEQTSAQAATVFHGAEQMTASIREISASARSAAQVAGQGVTITAEANTKVGKLDESSREIGQVIKVITSIAEQTHLLALNASIEAARAGVAGQGFAVVANEVKELAKETAKATEEISRKIQNIQTDTKGVIHGITEIGGIIAQISEIQNTIATAVEEQTSTTNEINQNIGGVAQAARSTTEGADYTNSAAGELAHLAGRLQALVAQFNFGASQNDPHESPPVAENAATSDPDQYLAGAPIGVATEIGLVQ